MSWLDFFKKKPKEEELSAFEQELARHGLLAWFRDTFSATDRARLEEQGRNAARGKQAADAVALLRALAPRGELGRRVLAKAEELAGGDPVALNQLHDAMVDRYVREAEGDKPALEEAIRVCERQIARAAAVKEALAKSGTKLPRHRGYEQLAILREKAGNPAEALRLAREAKQAGWAGDWDARIMRCEEKVRQPPADDDEPSAGA